MEKLKYIYIKFILLLFSVLLLLFTILYIHSSNNVENNSGFSSINNYEPTSEIPELDIIEEMHLEEQQIEDEGFEYQGKIVYESGVKPQVDIKLGSYQGLTYYSQIDSRWKNHPYTTINSSSQTIGISGCGPAAASMIVSSIKGAITPDTMGDLFVNNGYRSPDSGTYWSAFRWTADVFDIEYKEVSTLDDAISLINNNYYVIASCGSGLFTYGGHFVVLVGIDNDTLKIFDPYLYNGKFNVSTRRNKVDVKGTTCYVTINNFEKYANYRRFFAFKNNSTSSSPETNSDPSPISDYITISAKIGLNIRTGPDTTYKKIGAYSYNTRVPILERQGNWGKTDIGWICLNYTNASSSNINDVKFFKDYTYIYSNPDLTGTIYNYIPNTSVIVLENVSNYVDKVKVRMTRKNRLYKRK